MLSCNGQDEKFEEELCNLTPLQIHAYFQHKKQSASQITTKLKSNNSSLNSWHTSKGTYSMEQIEILKLDGKPNYYTAIDPKALRGLDSKLVEQFTTAIKKGIVSKDFSSTGINFILGKLIEVKINGDDRIYAKKIFKNPEGKYLVILNKYGAHTKVAKDSSSKLEIENTKNIKFSFDHKSLFNINEFSNADSSNNADESIHGDSTADYFNAELQLVEEHNENDN